MNILQVLKVSHVIHCNYNRVGGRQGRNDLFDFFAFIHSLLSAVDSLACECECKLNVNTHDESQIENSLGIQQKKKVPQLTKNANYN